MWLRLQPPPPLQVIKIPPMCESVPYSIRLIFVTYVRVCVIVEGKEIMEEDL